MEALSKYQIKHLHKTNGIIFEMQEAFDGALGITIFKSGDNKRYMYLIAFEPTRKHIEENFKLKDRIKIRFFIKAHKYKEKWQNVLVIMGCEEWKKQTRELKEQQAQEQIKQRVADNEYVKAPLNANIDFLEPKTEDPNQTKMNL